ncbi:hypothetical protein U1Q18_005501 [Sarracenia purpurea var. burkii]
MINLGQGLRALGLPSGRSVQIRGSCDATATRGGGGTGVGGAVRCVGMEIDGGAGSGDARADAPPFAIRHRWKKSLSFSAV